MSSLSRWSALWGRLRLTHLLLLALAVRVIWILICPNEATSDQAIYHQAATDLALGHGYVDESGRPAAFWPVGYSAYLAIFYAVFGAHLSSAFLANLVLGLATVAGSYTLGGALFGPAAARAAGLLVALYPTLVLYTTCIASENAFIAGVSWLLWLAVRIGQSPRFPAVSLVAFGCLIAAVAYVRATILPFFALPALAAWLHGKPVRQAALRPMLALAVTALLMLPWAFRNYHELGRFTPLSLNGASNLWMGNHEGASGGYAPIPPDVDGMSHLDRERILGARAKKFILENPGQYLWLSVKRLGQTLYSDTIAVTWNEVGIRRSLGASAVTPLKLLCTGAHYALFLCVVGVAFRRRRTGQWDAGDWLLLTSAVLLAVPFVFIVSGNRYHLPLIPVLTVWLSSSMAWLLHGKNTKAKSSGSRVPAII